MARLCERPGCSQPAEVIYGMSAERLTVWLEPFDVAQAARVGVLCRRHADAMVVPLGWLLDDRREPTPRLFRSPGSAHERVPDLADKPHKPRRRKHRASADETGQMELLSVPDETDGTGELPLPLPPAPDEPAAEVVEPEPEPEPEADAAPVAPWKPVFDQGSDLDGLLDVRSPLLSRAFRGRAPKP